MIELVTQYLPILLIGVGYGFIFGLIPVAGAQVALIALYPYAEHFMGDPYSMVVMTTAVVISATIGDMFSSVVLNIPGGGGSAATMIDGFPMAQRGEAARALSAGLCSAAAQSLIWGLLFIVLLPYYVKVVYLFGMPEMLLFLMLAMTVICFVSNRYWIRGIIAAIFGICVGLIGEVPDVVGEYRWTFGWDYLKSGIEVLPVMAGVLALPEIVEGVLGKTKVATKIKNTWTQMWHGAKDCWKYRWDSFRGGVVGGIIGALPGLGGGIGDYIAYSLTAVNKRKDDKVPFGKGNVRGVIGPEGANLSHKATAYFPTVLFGIPGAPFEVLVLALLAYVGLDLGSPRLLANQDFFTVLSFGYMSALLITVIISIFFIRYAIKLTQIPKQIWFPFLLVVIVWSCTRHTGGWNDYIILGIFFVIGFIMRYLKMNRVAFLIGFVLAAKIEKIGGAYWQLYHKEPLMFLTRPVSLFLLMITILIIIYALRFKGNKIEYY